MVFVRRAAGGPCSVSLEGGYILVGEGRGDESSVGVTVDFFASRPPGPDRANRAVAYLTDAQALDLAVILTRIARHEDTRSVFPCPSGCLVRPCDHELVARHAVNHVAGDDAITWEDYPDMGEDDWEDTAAWIEYMTNDPATGWDAAYDRMAARSAQWSKDNPEWC
jgi:hypothetical protein